MNRSKADKRNSDPPPPKKQREKRKSNFNNYNNLNLNGPVNFILSSSDRQNISDDENDEFRRSCEDQRSTDPQTPKVVFSDVHNSSHLNGIGRKLLLQMGYEPGKGLGKNLQGIQVPIKAKPRFGRGAIGAYGPENVNLETLNTPSNLRTYTDDKKQSCADVFQNNLIHLMRQISSMQIINENLDSIEIENNLQTDINETSSSWSNFMTELRSHLLKNFAYDPKNDSKLLTKPKTENSKRNIKTPKPKTTITETSNSLKMAIIDKGDVEGKIRNVIHQEILRKTLDEAVAERSENIMYWSEFKNDIFKIICEDESSKISLVEIVKNIGKIWYDADLYLLGLEDLLKFHNSLKEKNNITNPYMKVMNLKKLSAEYDKCWRKSEKKAIRRLERKSTRKNYEINCSNNDIDYCVPDTLKIAIVDKSNVEGKINNADNQNLLEDALLNGLINMCQIENIDLPHYHWSGFKDDIFKVICYDEQSKICMEKIVQNLGILWEGSDLAVVGLGKLLNMQQNRTVDVLKLDVEKSKRSKNYDKCIRFEQYELEESHKLKNKPCHKDPKEQRKQTKRSKSEILPEGFLIFIRKTSKEKFTHNEFKILKDSIELLIYECIKLKTFSPQFENIDFNGEYLCLICANLSTQEWFAKSVIPNLLTSPPWQNAEFNFEFKDNYEFKKDDDLKKFVAAKVWLPGLKLNFNDYLQMLETQNNLLDTKLWTFVNQKDTPEGVHLYLKIDKESALIVRKRPYFGSGRVKFKI